MMKPSHIFKPLVPLYASAIGLKNILYDQGLLHPQRLAWPVISVGNLSVGGTGKTPLVAELSARLQESGWTVDVLSRGHGRHDDRTEEVDPEGAVLRYGDEPLLLARNGSKVYVGRKRYDAGRLAEAQAAGKAHPRGPVLERSLHLLDDGLQHRKLARTVEIVLVDRHDLSDQLLPAGRLRESLSALRRADICVLREEERDLAAPVMKAMRIQDAARIWVQRRETTVESRLERAIAFCGVGNAPQFFSSLRQVEVSLAEEISFPDHHVYSDRDIYMLAERAKRCSADGFVTTEKDSVRLEGSRRESLQAIAPVHTAKLKITLLESERCLTNLEALLDLRSGMR